MLASGFARISRSIIISPHAILWKSQQRSGQCKGRELVGPPQGAETADHPQRQREFTQKQRDDLDPQRAPYRGCSVQFGNSAAELWSLPYGPEELIEKVDRRCARYLVRPCAEAPILHFGISEHLFRVRNVRDHLFARHRRN